MIYSNLIEHSTGRKSLPTMADNGPQSPRFHNAVSWESARDLVQHSSISSVEQGYTVLMNWRRSVSTSHRSPKRLTIPIGSACSRTSQLWRC
jgi:hypothetical protein